MESSTLAYWSGMTIISVSKRVMTTQPKFMIYMKFTLGILFKINLRKDELIHCTLTKWEQNCKVPVQENG